MDKITTTKGRIKDLVLDLRSTDVFEEQHRIKLEIDRLQEELLTIDNIN
jgi:hypothetical protein